MASMASMASSRRDAGVILMRTRRGARGDGVRPSSSSSSSASAAASARRPRRRVEEEAYDGATTSAFERSGGLLYVRNFFPEATFARVREECEALRERVTVENRACARDRLGMMIPEDNFVHRAFVASEVADKMRALLLGEDCARELIPGDVPVEYRIYPIGGSMDWHKDVALYTKPQYEIVFTVANTSDSTTEWEDERTGMRYGGWTEPNSVIVVKADGVAHRVTPITVGERSIIKFVLTQTLEKTDDFFDNLLTYAK